MILDSLDRSLGVIYRVGVYRLLGVLVVMLIGWWWMRREGDTRAVELVKESARLMEASLSKNGTRALMDVSAALALVDAADKYEPSKPRLKRALGGVDPVTYRAFVKRTLDGLL